MRSTTTSRTASSRWRSTSGRPSSPTPVRLAREHRAESVSIDALLHPASIAVVGASRRSASIGHRFLANILGGGYAGPVYAVNNEALEVLGLPAYARVGEIPGPVDLAVVAVPADSVLDVVDECAAKGVRNLLVASAGFAESGAEGTERQDQLRRRARENGLRVVGPNSFGLINTDPDVCLNASLAPRMPSAGGLGLFAQSGALGIAVLASADRRGLGVSDFASAGNRVDVSGNDLMQYWIDDDNDRGRRALPRVDRQPPQVLPHRPRAGAAQAGHRRLVRGVGLRRPARTQGPADATSRPVRSGRCSGRPA